VGCDVAWPFRNVLEWAEGVARTHDKPAPGGPLRELEGSFEKVCALRASVGSGGGLVKEEGGRGVASEG
jgi:hypothetical protein